ncbi:MAG TPA: glycosyltransferase [Acidimicrobiales bacterium]|nr:glycosyltransferase [Acidimicrobiales bacterium]
MRLAVVASDLPHPQGTAAGRDLWAWCEAVLALGHELEAWIWYRSPLSPEGPVPWWAHYDPVPAGPRWRAHLRGLVLPRSDAATARWRPPDDAVPVADHLLSASAVLGLPRSVVTLHYRALLDARSVHQVQLRDVQSARGERRAARHAELVLAYSERVGRGLAKPAHTVPITHPIPDVAIATVEEPVAALLADWTWPPNAVALSTLLSAWPAAHNELPGARLVLGGRGFPAEKVGTMAGVEVVGPVADSLEVLGRAAMVAFPCPASSGPKVKTLEALAHGLPVLTSTAGMEGIGVDDDLRRSLVADGAGFGARLVELLRSPEERHRLGARGRQAVAEHHSPKAAAQARLDLFARAFGR